MISIKTEQEIERMRASGALLARCMKEVLLHVKPGVTTFELDVIAQQCITGAGAVPSFKGYPGPPGCRPFPGSICVSVNEEVVHGVPKKEVLKDGDILSIDMGAILSGWHSDMARTVGVGEISEEATKLIRVTKDSFYAGMNQAVPGNRLNDISSAIEKVILSQGMGVVRDLVGHGIGREMHESPEIPNFSFRGRVANPRLSAGMVFAIEPMVALGTGAVVWRDERDWPVTTRDKTLSAHYENTVAITEHGPEILTKV